MCVQVCVCTYVCTLMNGVFGVDDDVVYVLRIDVCERISSST